MYLLYILASLILLEIIVYLLVHYLRKDYQWLIVAEDENPYFDKKGLEKFIKHGYDPELGWVRKPNTSGREKGRDKEVVYNINAIGSRVNPGFEDLPSEISCYGDSFAFCRQVEDAETWEYYLSEQTNTNVLNFGVGNYGIDQALIRLKREYSNNKTDIVILAVVPETISRVLNVWKHYHEYGNIFGFKPRYKVENGKLVLVNNVIDNVLKFDDVDKYLDILRKNDYFYEKKFKKDILRFPYIFSLIRTGKRNIPLICRLVLEKIYGLLGIRKDYKEHLHNISVLKRNISLCAELYKNDKIIKLMETLIKDFVDFSKEQGFTPVFLMLPQLNDIFYVKQYGNYYKNFLDLIKDNLYTIDLTDLLMSLDNPEELYSNDQYGGHFSKVGNKYVADILFGVLSKKGILES